MNESSLLASQCLRAAASKAPFCGDAATEIQFYIKIGISHCVGIYYIFGAIYSCSTYIRIKQDCSLLLGKL